MGKKLVILGADFEENAAYKALPALDVQIKKRWMVNNDNTGAANYNRSVIGVLVNSAVSTVTFDIKSAFKISSLIYYDGENLDLPNMTSADTQAHVIGRSSPWQWHTGTYTEANISGATYILVNVAPVSDQAMDNYDVYDILNSVILA